LPIDDIGTVEPREGTLSIKFLYLVLHSEEKIGHTEMGYLRDGNGRLGVGVQGIPGFQG